MEDRVLIVDDDPEILESFRRYFFRVIRLSTASGGRQGLKMVSETPFAVVVSDYMMPQMDGIQFLTRVKEISPDSTRIMLTGYADVNLAIDAVNEGHIFHFLTKPCPPDKLAKAIQAGLDYYNLHKTERELLEQTLNGSISMLVEILGLVNPVAFSRATRLKKMVAEVVQSLQVTPVWFYELAAMLSQIGFVTLPTYLLEKVYQQRPLSSEEQRLLDSHPQIGRGLIEKIPRLEMIAPMIGDQNKRYSDFMLTPGSQLPRKPAVLGAQILKVVGDYDDLGNSGYLHPEILSIMRSRGGEYNPAVLDVVDKTFAVSSDLERRKVYLHEVEIGMVVDEDVFTMDRQLLLRRGQEFDATVLARLRNFALYARLQEPFQVYIPPQRRAEE